MCALYPDYVGPAYGHLGKGAVVQSPVDTHSPKTPLIGSSRERHTGQSHRAPERVNQPLDTRPSYTGYGATGVTADHSDLTDSKMDSQKGASMAHDQAPDEYNRQQQNIVVKPLLLVFQTVSTCTHFCTNVHTLIVY